MKELSVANDIESWEEFEEVCANLKLDRGLNKGGKKVTWVGKAVIVQQLDVWEEYEYRLQTHDWTHAMSDDPRSYHKGENEMVEIKRLQLQCAHEDAARADEIFKQYSDLGWGRSSDEK